jgi:hypothetical protein
MKEMTKSVPVRASKFPLLFEGGQKIAKCKNAYGDITGIIQSLSTCIVDSIT